MSTEDKVSKLLAQILRATYAGVVEWSLSPPPADLTKNTDNFVPMFLKARYKNSTVVIYEERGKHWTDEDSFNWGVSIRFGFMVIGGVVVTEPVRWSPILRELFEAAKKQASGVDSLIDNLLD